MSKAKIADTGTGWLDGLAARDTPPRPLTAHANSQCWHRLTSGRAGDKRAEVRRHST